MKEFKLLKIYVSEAEKWEGKPLYEQVVLLAKKESISGATVCKGFMGFGEKSHMHDTKLLRLSENLPVIIDIVDTKEKIEKFLDKIEDIVSRSLVIIQDVKI